MGRDLEPRGGFLGVNQAGEEKGRDGAETQTQRKQEEQRNMRVIKKRERSVEQRVYSRAAWGTRGTRI